MNMIRFHGVILLAILFCSYCSAQEPIRLPKPDTTGGKPLMQSLKERKTSRSFAKEKLSPQILSNLLWAAFGINRPDGHRTAPSAMNWQEMDIYVVMEDGVFLYDAASHSLKSVSFAAVAYRYPVYQRLASLIPESQLPKTESDREAQAPNLVQRYPQDPRSHLYLAAALSAAHDNAGAEREARTALQQAESFRFFLGPQLENGVRVVLAAILLDEGRKEDAKETARIACQTLPSDPSAEKVRKILTDNRLCD